MHCVEALAAGVVGAESGTAVLYRRGTSLRASWFDTFGGPTFSDETVQLDGHGGASVYVNELVDVVVMAVDGQTVREFTAGAAATAVEVVSDAFSGIDYETGAVGVNKPTTLHAALAQWTASAGAKDFRVLVGSAEKTLQAALSGALRWFNVRDSDYGAIGDGAADDTGKIQAAIDAANAAGGGAVFFPSGTYRITAALNLPAIVDLIGSGPVSTAIRLDHASANTIRVSTAVLHYFQRIENLRLDPQQVNTGNVVDSTVGVTALLVTNCEFGISGNLQGNAFNTSGSATLRDCLVLIGGVTGRVGTFTLLKASFCSFFLDGAVAYAPVQSFVGSHELWLDHCFFSTAAATSGAHQILRIAGFSSIVGCLFLGPPGPATATAITVVGWATPVAEGIAESSNTFLQCLPLGYNATATTPSNVQLASRERLFSSIDVAASAAMQSAAYGTVKARITTNAVMTLTLQAGAEGAEFTLIVHNESGGVTGNISLSANVRTVAVFTIADTKINVYRFKCSLIGGALVWVLVASSTGL